MTPGLETIVDASGCSPEALRNPAAIRQLCERVVRDLDLQVVGQPQWHTFPDPGGVTALYLLSESHLACHTYPEFGLATFNLYCCRERVAWDWKRWLTRELGAQRVEIRVVRRGEHLLGLNRRTGDFAEIAHAQSAEQNASVSAQGPRS